MQDSFDLIHAVIEMVESGVDCIECKSNERDDQDNAENLKCGFAYERHHLGILVSGNLIIFLALVLFTDLFDVLKQFFAILLKRCVDFVEHLA